MPLSYLPYKEIDHKKWDDCIQHAKNSLLYAWSFYLDAMTENRDAIVLDDYAAVMPLTWKRKWGIKYLYQPAFIQQAGIFYKEPLTQEEMQSFITLAQQHFNFAEITLNFSNDIEWPDEGLQVERRNNFILDLDKPYDILYDNYHPSFTKSLRRIKKFGMRYTVSGDYRHAIELYKKLYGSRLPFFEDKDYALFEKLCTKLSAENNLIVRHAYDAQNHLLSVVMLLKDENRLYNIISCITEEGKKLEANYFLYDCIIREFAGSRLLLDFEGSDVEGIAAFYKKFNPENQPYPFIRYNNLPAIVKLFKP